MQISINGFGRIGKCVLRAVFEDPQYQSIKIHTINAPSMSLEGIIYAIKYDSVHGVFGFDIEIVNENSIKIKDQTIRIISERDHMKIKWINTDVLIESSGKFLDHKTNSIHLKNGAKKIIISAPPKSDDIKMFIKYVNEDQVNFAHENILSIGSCTTNCLAPILKILNENFTITNGFMTTVHAYTNDQKLVDSYHENDLRRSRAASNSIIPTSTGAAKSIGKIIPGLDGKIDGVSIRVPVVNVSMLDLHINILEQTSKLEVNKIFAMASQKMKNTLKYISDPVVSIDLIHTKESAIFDSLETKVITKNLIRLCAWYDNEWSFATRMLDLALLWKI